MTATPLVNSVTDIYTAINAWLVALVDPAVPVILGQQNRVAPPNTDNFVVYTPMGRTRNSGNIITYNGAGNTRQVEQKTVYAFQLDVYGDGSGDMINVIVAFARDDTSQFFPPFAAIGMAITDITDPMQTPWNNTEAQVEERWMATMSVQVNVAAVVAQDFASIVADHAVAFSNE